MPPPVEGNAALYCTENALKIIRSEIAQAGGTEVFFIGRREFSGLIDEVEAHAYGNNSAVSAIVGHLRSGQVILHNHPSGVLLPSEPDLIISQQVSEMGVGSYICNNECTAIRIIVRPHDVRKKTLLNAQQIELYFQAASPLAKEMTFEERPQQRIMASMVCKAFNDEAASVVEAGTGTGKSLAYLIPSLVYAVENKERVLISTNTINLQEQILQKDLPVLERVMGQPIKAEIVKGRSNYVCKRKAEFAREELQLGGQQSFLEDEIRKELTDLLAWAKSSASGDRQELNVHPRDEAWEKVGSEADNCLRLRCKFYEECFFYNSRRRAATADLMIVNHSLLLSDLAVRRESNNWSTAAVLPPAKHLILDEAHHLEESATRHLAAQLSKFTFRRLFRRLYRADGRGKQGILPSFCEKLNALANGENTPGLSKLYSYLIERVIPDTEDAQSTTEHLMDEASFAILAISGLSLPRFGQEERFRLRSPMMEGNRWKQEVNLHFLKMSKLLQEIITTHRAALKRIKEMLEEDSPELINLFMEWRANIERLENTRQILLLLIATDEKTCRWVEFRQDKKRNLMATLCASPIDVAEILHESMHTRFKTQVLTSATLTVEKDFKFLYDRIGLIARTPNYTTNNESEETRVSSARPIYQKILESPFNYSKQVFFGVPNDLGDVRRSPMDFEANLSRFIVQAITISEGRAFILFTSYKQLMSVYNQISASIQAMGFDVYRQGEESRTVLLEKFRENETSVLFATSSFWEGVDVRGRSLELLILAKLPFTVPNDPVAEAQYEYIEAQGGDAFNSLVVPRAIVRFKQGFGRLIRSQTDRGAVLVADDRIQSMAYGRRFVKSLPEMNVHHHSSQLLFEKMQNFFEHARSKP